MNHSTKSPTKAEREHLAAVKAMPCIACNIACTADWISSWSTEVHHTLSGNRRRGHMFVLPLCSWHHRGEPLDGWAARSMEATFGPSLARSSRQFRERYGTDDELLAKIDALLAARRAA